MPPSPPPQVCDPECGRNPLLLLADGTRYFYLPWILGYYLLVFIVLGDFLKRNAYQTLFDRVTTTGPSAKVLTALFRRCAAPPRERQPPPFPFLRESCGPPR